MTKEYHYRVATLKVNFNELNLTVGSVLQLTSCWSQNKFLLVNKM
jgi:hypothetical protein